MIHSLRALALLALVVPVAAAAQSPKAAKAAVKPAKASAKAGKASANKPAKARPAKQSVEPVIIPSEAAARVMTWVSTSKDHVSLPWAVVDKTNAALFLFDADGKQVAAVPVLIGIAPGDDASPGVGNKKLSDLGPAEKTTPAGRYLAKFGLPVAGERVLWVDYATSVALHPIPGDAGAKERRRERMLSPTPDDNRITFGCINVPKAFYSGLLRPMFRRKGGYVYVLPDSKPLEDVFPGLWTQPAPVAAPAQ